ncbi:MAG: flavodoxin family protein [Phycisphaerales bacterium]|jgi:multimeric flavodoxin WrbA|nr:flavodoxin family protein [Phycisphaerales bacterium]MBT7171807.1 flavodoxin family protein [Phycisphaerales bacterium]
MSKVVAFTASPRREGNTFQSLQMAIAPLEAAGIEVEVIDVCAARPRGCMACFYCLREKNSTCVINEDPVNEWIAKAVEADGVIFASPTYFANVTSEMKALIDRMGMVSRVNGSLLKRKPFAAITAVRRGGAVPAFDAMNHMAQINEMIVVGSCYWNFAFGLEQGDVQNDEEGIKTMVTLGETMAWLIQAIEGK